MLITQQSPHETKGKDSQGTCLAQYENRTFALFFKAPFFLNAPGNPREIQIKIKTK
jgi:hypothetical protein